MQDINKHLRPISLTTILSKIAEEYVAESYVKPAVLQKIDPQQFGTIPKIQHHACVNKYDTFLGEINGWKWIDYESYAL